MIILLGNGHKVKLKESKKKDEYLDLTRNWCSVMVKTMDSGIVVSEFELQSRYYVHFRTNALKEGMNPLILLATG